MKTCKDCKYADWQRTKAGRLHPSGDGMCAYPFKIPRLPLAFYFIGGPPSPCGGHISRGREFKEHCPYWSSANSMICVNKTNPVDACKPT